MAAYEIIALGDAEMLRQAFEGVALIAGGGDFQTMIKIGLLVGMLFGFAKAIITSKFDLTPMIVGFFIYMVMFGPKVTVHIVDPYGDLPLIYCETPGACTAQAGGVVDVGNVPMGIAAPMYIITQFGHGVSEKFSQVFSAPDMFQKGDGYLNALRLLSKLRNFDGAVANNNGDDSGGADMRRSFVLFWRDCVKFSLDAGQKSYDGIYRSTNISGALDVQNVARDTILYVDGNPRQASCKEASDTLLPMLQPGSNFSENLKAALPKSDVSGTFDALATAVQDVTKDASLSAERLMMNAYVRNMMSCAQADVPPEACVTMTQATEQRQAQWAAEQTFFKQVARPLMSFVELFVVAATPIMAFLVASGLGLSLAMRYFGMIAWVALWPVTMTICNIYIYNAAGRAILAKAPTTGDAGTMFSVYGMEGLFSTAADWVSTGGMLASSVPALTLMLVYGSAQTATHLAGRLQSGDQINEKLMAPDISSPAAISQSQSRFTHNPSLGGLKTGMEGGLDRMQIGETAQSVLTNARSAVTDASNNLQQTYGSDLQAGIQKLHSDANTKAWMKTAEQSMTKTQQVALQTARENMVKAGVSEREADALMEKGAVRASLGFNAFGMGAGAELGTETTKGKTAEQMKAIENAWRQSASTLDSTANAFRTALSNQSGRTITDSLGNNMSETKRAGFQETVGKLLRANEQVSENESRAGTLGAAGDKDVRTWAGMVKGAGLGGQVTSLAGSLGLSAEANKNAGIYRGQGMDADLAQIAGAGMALQNAGLHGNGAALEGITGIHAAISGVTPNVHGPAKGLGDTHYAGTMAKGDEAVAAVAPKVAGVPGAVADADKLMPDAAPAGQAPGSNAVPNSTPAKPAHKPAGGHHKPAPAKAPAHAADPGTPQSPSSPKVSPADYPAGYTPPSSTAPSPDSLMSDQQRQFLQAAKDKQTPSGANMGAIVDKMPAMAGAVKDGVGHGVDKAVDYAKEHPVETAVAVAEVATAVTAAGVVRAAGGAIVKRAGTKLAQKVAPKLFEKEAAKGAARETISVTPRAGKGPEPFQRGHMSGQTGETIDGTARVVTEPGALSGPSQRLLTR